MITILDDFRTRPLYTSHLLQGMGMNGVYGIRYIYIYIYPRYYLEIAAILGRYFTHIGVSLPSTVLVVIIFIVFQYLNVLLLLIC